MKRFTRKTFFTLTLGLSIASIATPAFAATYQVQPDDTMWKIAAAKNIPLESIQKANPKVDPLNLQSGQALNLPDVRYTVQEGDTFWIIANRLKLPLKELMATNPKVDPLNLYSGLVLTLPSAAPAKANTVQAAQASTSANIISASANTVNVSGQALPYKKVMPMRATAYSDAPEENGWGAVDYYGNPLKLGTIAVDPAVIPMGSKVFITGYNFKNLPDGGLVAYATDQGSAIKGNRIDIFIPGHRDMVANFGFQDVQLYVMQ